MQQKHFVTIPSIAYKLTVFKVETHEATKVMLLALFPAN